MIGVLKKQNSEWSVQNQSQCFKGALEPYDNCGDMRTRILKVDGVWEPFVNE